VFPPCNTVVPFQRHTTTTSSMSDRPTTLVSTRQLTLVPAWHCTALKFCLPRSLYAKATEKDQASQATLQLYSLRRSEAAHQHPSAGLDCDILLQSRSLLYSPRWSERQPSVPSQQYYREICPLCCLQSLDWEPLLRTDCLPTNWTNQFIPSVRLCRDAALEINFVLHCGALDLWQMVVRKRTKHWV